MKYLLMVNRGLPHFCNGAQILPVDDNLHTQIGKFIVEHIAEVKPNFQK